MPFIGQQPITGAYSKLDAITTSATATYNLLLGSAAYSPASANHLLVSLNGVMQAPQDSFTVSGSTITFASALTSSDNIDFIMALGDVLNIGTPSDGTVTSAKLAGALTTPSNLTVGGNATVSGNTASSGTLTSTGLITASAGVAIGGTGSANTLDDYEEGTWTPLFKATSSNPTISYDTQLGFYTKIGNLVFLTFALEINTISSSGSGDVYIDLPFHAPASVDYATGGWMPSRMSNSASLSGSRTDLSFSLTNGTNAMRLTQSGGSSSSTQWTNGVSTGQIGAATELSGTYMLRLSS